MSVEQQYQREPNGIRFGMTGMNTVLPYDAIGNKYPYLQNVRAYTQGRMRARAPQNAPLQTMGGPVHSLRRLNDSTPNGPSSGYALIGGAAGSLYLNSTVAATGFTGNPFSLVPFRPNLSPQPWMYIADASPTVNIAAQNFNCTGMVKIRSDGLTRKTGIKEPQNAPAVSTQATTVKGTDTVLGTARPWSNVSGANPSYNYGDNGNGSGPSIIATPTVGASLTLTATGTAFVNGVSHSPGDAGGLGTSNPGHFVTSPQILLAAWTDSSGNIVTGTGAGVVNVGAGATLVVPVGATQLQVGIDGTGGAFSGNSGSFSLAYTLVTSAVTTVVSTIGSVQAYVWGTPPPAGGGSPHSGPVADYIWKNPGDTGSGTSRTITLPTPDASPSNNSWQLHSSPADGTVPMQWDTLDSSGTITGAIPLFSPQLESEGYQDFNVCFVGNLFFPAGGAYTFTFVNKDQIMVGIGGNASVPGGPVTGVFGQTESVVNALPLLLVTAANGAGTAVTTTLVVTVPSAGVYPIEIDFDYWEHTGRELNMTVNGAVVPPLTGNVKESVAYRYDYRAGETGATSNPSPASPAASVPSISNTITPDWSPDPQVTKVDFYRMDQELDNFTYVGTGPNTNPPTPFVDESLDNDVVGNPIMEFDNYEPFPSIDLPKGGIVNVIGGIVQWVSGDQFNIRWLGGTIINIGGLPYVLYNRPSNTTTLLAVDVPDGTGLIYEITEPILAAQPMQSMWGDTDNAAYVFAVGDPLRPGTLYWCKGNNLDSAPDTNQQDVTSPSEPLINGVLVGGIGMVMSAENGWVIYPNFYSALATVQGVEGSAFTLQRSNVTRGLYIRPCIATDGSGTFFYRSKDGIEKAVGAGEQTSLTNDDLYNIFPHEGFTPQVITLAGFSIVPPDDTFPELQKLTFATGYLYYDYRGIDGNRHTIVLDVAGNGWVVDVYGATATCHMLEEGPAVNGTLTGCLDGTVRALSNVAGTESAQAVVCTPSMNSGDARANKNLGDVFLKASVVNYMQVGLFTNQYLTTLGGFSPATLPSYSLLTKYIIDFTNGNGADVSDISMSLVWPLGDLTFVDLWQPDWTALPENTQDRPTDWTDGGSLGPSFWQGVTLEADTLGNAKAIVIQDDTGTAHIPDQSPVVFNGQSKQTLTFTPPFVAYMVRIMTTDGVPWRLWPTPEGAWTKLPFPPSVVEWQTQMTSMGGRAWQHIREMNVAYLSTAPLFLTLTFDPGAYPGEIIIPIPSSNGYQSKIKITVPENKFKLVSFRMSGASAFRVFAEDFVVKIGDWGRQGTYREESPIGGMAAPGASV
jgi:hypothetical protein